MTPKTHGRHLGSELRVRNPMTRDLLDLWVPWGRGKDVTGGPAWGALPQKELSFPKNNR